MEDSNNSNELYFSTMVTKSLEPVNSDERFFEGLLTVEMKDKQGEITIVDELYKVLPVWMDRGAPISDTHSNRIIGKGINFSKTVYKGSDGEELPAIRITGKIFKNYELDNDIWGKIKSGEYKGLSFGGATRANRTPMAMKDGSVAYALKELEHYEVAVCKDPAVPLALITDYNPLAKAIVGNSERRDNDKLVIKCSKFGCYIKKNADLTEEDTFDDKVKKLIADGKSKESAEKIVGSFVKASPEGAGGSEQHGMTSAEEDEVSKVSPSDKWDKQDKEKLRDREGELMDLANEQLNRNQTKPIEKKPEDVGSTSIVEGTDVDVAEASGSELGRKLGNKEHEKYPEPNTAEIDYHRAFLALSEAEKLKAEEIPNPKDEQDDTSNEHESHNTLTDGGELGSTVGDDKLKLTKRGQKLHDEIEAYVNSGGTYDMYKAQFKELNQEDGTDHSNSEGETQGMYNQNAGRESWVGNGSPYPKTASNKLTLTEKQVYGGGFGGGVRHSGKEYDTNQETAQVTEKKTDNKHRRIKLSSDIIKNSLKHI